MFLNTLGAGPNLESFWGRLSALLGRKNVFLPNSDQAKSKLNFNLAELALFSESPTTHPPPFPAHPHPPTRESLFLRQI